MTILQFIIITVLAYLSLSGLYQTILAIASHTKKKADPQVSSRINKFLILVPAYKCDEVILHCTYKNLQLKYLYPNKSFDLQVIADQLKESTIQQLRNMGAMVHDVKFDQSTKVKSLQSAIRSNHAQYDGIVILDADNIAEVNLLYHANKYLNQGHHVVQGNRKAANANSQFALLDGLSEKANTHMLCQGANQLGLSSKLSGSGMVFDYKVFERAIEKMSAIGGFDKELELYFTSKGEFIKYADEIVVYDEKTSTSEAFAKQRGRWLQAQYNFFKASILPATNGLLKGNYDYFHKAMQLALPPRALSPFVLLLGFILSLFLGFYTGMILSFLGLALTLGSYCIVLNPSHLINNGIRLILTMPALALSVIKSISMMGKAKKEFIHTEHQIITAA